jgi:hypothetical protein
VTGVFPAFRTADKIAIKATGSLQIVNRKRQVKTGSILI